MTNSLLDQFKKPTNQSSGRVNIAITVTNYIDNPQNPDDQRMIGTRIDTGEIVEVHVPKADNPNQPSISSIRRNALAGGAVMLAEAYIDHKTAKKTQDASYVMACRWPRLLSPSASNGQARVVMARIQNPIFHDGGNVTMNVTVVRDATQVQDMNSFYRAFYEALNPETTPMNANPIAGIRIVEFDGNGNAQNSVLRQFMPAFNDDRSPANIQTTYDRYQTQGTESNAYLQEILPALDTAIQNPSYSVEVVKLMGFSVGTETKKSIKKKCFDNLPMNTWEVVPTLLNSGQEGEENYVGFTECVVGFRKSQAHGGEHFYLICGAMPKERNGIVTRSGIVTAADQRSHNEYLQRLAEQRQANQQAPAQQPGQPSKPQQPYTPTQANQNAPAFENPYEQLVGERSQQHVNHQAPEVTSSHQQGMPQAPAKNPAPSPAPAPAPAPARAPTPEPTPAPVPTPAPAATPFLIQETEGDWIAITPPNANPDLEDSLFTNLCTLSSNGLQQSGFWYFPAGEYNQIKEQLEAALNVVSIQHPELGGGIVDQTTRFDTQAPAASGKNVAGQSGNDLDLGELGQEIDQMFAQQNNNGLGM